MRKFFYKISVFSVALILASCTQPIALKRISIDSEGVKSYGNSPERNFHVDRNLGDSLAVLWKTSANGSFAHTSVSVYNDFIFVPDLSGRLYVFNKSDGQIAGFEVFKGEIPTSIVIETNKSIFVHNEPEEEFFYLYYFNFVFSKVHEKILIKGKCTNEIIKLKDGIVLLTEEGNLYKFDFIGNQIWKYSSGNLAISSPASNSETILWGNVKGEILAVNAKDGKLIYKSKLSDGFEAGLTISGKHGFIGDIYGDMISFNIEDGSLNWKSGTSDKIKSLAVFNDKDLFIGNLRGDIYSMSKTTGEINWEIITSGIINTTPLLFNDFLLQPDLDRKVLLIDIYTGEIVKQIEYNERVKTTPVYFDNTIYIGTDRGELYAYETIK